jgi:Integrase zinc binding domain
MLNELIAFYHQVQAHVGGNWLYLALKQIYHHRNLQNAVNEYVKTCDTCQHSKIQRTQYGELPERIADSIPWSTVAVDCIGPWQIQDVHRMTHVFNALTIIDIITKYLELVRFDNKTAEHVAMQFKNQWLARYPRPNSVIFDPRTEFKGAFWDLLRDTGITPSPTTVKIPQATSGKCLGCFIRRAMFALCGEIKHHLGRFSFSHGFPFPDRKKTTRRMKTKCEHKTFGGTRNF